MASTSRRGGTRNGRAAAGDGSATVAVAEAPAPAVATVGQYLIDRLGALGVEHVFGIPGDYVLQLYKLIEESPIRLVGMTREDNAGFAADAYARIHGLGCICVTYCVGGLSTCNSIAGAYAEKSPVIVLGGSPGLSERRATPCSTTRSRDSRRSSRSSRRSRSPRRCWTSPRPRSRRSIGCWRRPYATSGRCISSCRGTRSWPGRSSRIGPRESCPRAIPRPCGRRSTSPSPCSRPRSSP